MESKRRPSFTTENILTASEVARKWFGSAKSDKNLAIAWQVEKKKELEETAKQLPIPPDSVHQPKKILTIFQWANAYLEECQRRNTLATFKEKRDGFRRFIRYLEKSKDLSPDDTVDTFDRRKARVYLAWQNDQRGPNCSNKDRKTLTTAWRCHNKTSQKFHPSKTQKGRTEMRPFSKTHPRD